MSHDRLQHVLDTETGLGRAAHRLAGRDADDVLDLGDDTVRFGRGQVDLVENGEHLDALLDGGVAIGHRLRLDALAGVDHQQRTLAGGQRAAHFVTEVDVTRRVDEIKAVGFAVARLVGERGGLRLDGDATLALEVHRIEHLRLHLAVCEPPTLLDEAVGQRALAVVDVGDDGEVADQFLHKPAIVAVTRPAGPDKAQR